MLMYQIVNFYKSKQLFISDKMLFLSVSGSVGVQYICLGIYGICSETRCGGFKTDIVYRIK